MNVSELARKAVQFGEKLDRLKASLGPQDFEWYRYGSLSNWVHLEKLLTGENRELAEGKPILDIGCADGDMAFFLESAGYEVTAIDYPVTNHNHMAGVRKLRDALGSRVEILAMDIDTQFQLPAKDYGLALILGAIYHLKNPLYLLEKTSKHARRTMLSTRIARRFPGVKDDLRNVSGAYLLGSCELNQDNSNYWIFTEAGFRQMLARSNWDVLDLKTFGNTEASDPIHADHDERVFCYAQSRYAMANVELLSGWNDPEGEGWRWAERRFSVRIRTPQGSGRAALRMQLYVPQELLSKWGVISVQSNAGPLVEYRESGFHLAVFDLGPQNGSELEVVFELSHALPPDNEDARERGIIVHSLEAV